MKNKGETGINLDENVSEEFRNVFLKAEASSNSSANEKVSVIDDGGREKNTISASEQEQTKNGGKAMADEKELREQVKAEVSEILKQKDAEASIAKKISDKDAEIATMQASSATLEKELSDAKASTANVSSELETVKAEVETLKTQNQTLASERETALTQASTLQKQIDQIVAEKTVAERTEVLTQANILMPEGDLRVKQVEKVTAMKKEDFDSYVAELSAIASKKEPTTKEEVESTTASTKIQTAEQQADEKVKKAIASTPAVKGMGDIFARSVAAASDGVKVDADMVKAYASI
ncbi:MAG: hypothetical protein M0P71_01445 [Melioribacteraceae bacterium]|nr:hypothetical protein [Melioribacteraceae bacterium]